MLFTSVEFFVFLGITFFFYYLPYLRERQTTVLVLSSVVFYSWTKPDLLVLLLTSILFNAFISYHLSWTSGRLRKRLAVIGIVFNLALLMLFKYCGLFATTFLTSSNIDLSSDELVMWLIHLPLPIGISFYTFEGISLLVDTYREPQSAPPRWIDPKFSRHFLRTSLFVAFFPHLISGPVLKAKTFLPQIQSKKFSSIEWSSATQLMLTGYFFKVFVANNLQSFTLILKQPTLEIYSSFDIFILIFAYSMQIFADFEGYSLIAKGLALLFGYDIMRNFDYPYIAISVSEFWKRWHISLSSWLRDYLYFPLGGNRNGRIRTCINLLVVMGLGGLWHGASWSFAIWGLLHGFVLVLERLLGLDSNPPPNPRFLRTIVELLRTAIVITFVSFAWILFFITDITELRNFTRVFASNLLRPPLHAFSFLTLYYSMPIIMYHIPHIRLVRSSAALTGITDWSWRTLSPIAYGSMAVFIILNPGPSKAFIYFQF